MVIHKKSGGESSPAYVRLQSENFCYRFACLICCLIEAFEECRKFLTIHRQNGRIKSGVAQKG